MHRQVREHLEEVLTEPSSGTQETVGEHLAECRECGDEVRAMREQAAWLRQLRVPAGLSEEDAEKASAPRAGFYARVMERIEAEGPGSIWSLFFESVFGRRLAAAALALAVLLAVCLISAERFSGPDSVVAERAGQAMPELRGDVVLGEDQPGVVFTGAPDDDSVLVNLVTYREQ